MINKIEIVQGDISDIFKFQRKNDKGEVITTKPKKMWITFKINSNYKDSIFQKTLDNGISFNEEDKYYRFQLEPEDTQNLNYGTYGFDIAIINEAGKKKTLKKDGKLEIVEHYTHKNNEV